MVGTPFVAQMGSLKTLDRELQLMRGRGFGLWTLEVVRYIQKVPNTLWNADLMQWAVRRAAVSRSQSGCAALTTRPY